MKASEILSALPNLSKEDLQRIKTHASGLLSMTGVQKVFNEPAYKRTWLFDAISNELDRRGKPRPQCHVWDKTLKTYAMKEGPIIEWLEGLIPKLSRVERAALGAIAVDALCSYVEEYTPVSWKTLARNIDRLSEAIDRAFPSYVSSGLIYMVLSTRRNHASDHAQR